MTTSLYSFGDLTYRIIRYDLFRDTIFIWLPSNLFPGRFNRVFWFFSPPQTYLQKSSFMYLSYILRLNACISTRISFCNSRDCFSRYVSERIRTVSDNLSAIAPSGTLHSLAASIQSMKFYSPRFRINIWHNFGIWKLIRPLSYSWYHYTVL